MTILRTIQSTMNQHMSHQGETTYKLIYNDMRKFNVCEMVHHNEEKFWFLMNVNQKNSFLWSSKPQKQKCLGVTISGRQIKH